MKKQKELRTSMFAFGAVLALLLLFGFQNCSPMLPLDGVVDSSSVAVRATATPNSGSALPVDTGSVGTGPTTGSSYDGSCSTNRAAQPMAVAGTGDVPGGALIAFTNPDGRAAFWNISRGAVARGSVCWMSSNAWKVIAVGDFNCDTNPDVAWMDASYNVVVWLMSGSTRLSAALVGTAGPGWQVEGNADFNADGKSDLLWRNSNGSYTVWFMNGLKPAVAGSGGTMPNASIVSTVNFNAGARAQILWNNGGTYSVTSFDSSNNPSNAAMPTGIFSPFSRVIGFGDFNGDGMTDFFGIKSSDGNLYVRYMNGNALLSDSTPFASPPATWSFFYTRDVVGSGFAAGDGIPDWIWTVTNANGTFVQYTPVSVTPSTSSFTFPTPIQSGFSVFQYPHF